MNATSHIQSRIATNAARIATAEAMKQACINWARHWRARDEKSFAADEFDKASKYASKLRKLHATQKALYVELKAGYASQRITAKLAKIEAATSTRPIFSDDMTTFEKEAALDAILAKIA